VLYFSKPKVLIIYSILFVLSFFSLLNLNTFNNHIPFSKKINLGLDLQGGSYLLLEVDTKPVIKRKLQNKLIALRKTLKDENINYSNLNIQNQNIIIQISTSNIELFEKFFLNKENNINTYYDNYKSFELNYSIEDDFVTIKYSKYGLIEIKNSSLDQSLEIVRKRIDEIGTKEPTIIKRGSDRILIELPGIDDPNRIKKLLGQTASLSFRLVSTSEDDFGSELLSVDNSEEKIKISKRVLLSGDNLVNARAAIDNRSGQVIVNFTLDRSGAKKFARVTTNNVGKRLAIILDKKVISSPQISESIIGGSGQITGNFTFQTATDLALLLRSGALPAPLKILEERTVGPDLGEDSIKSGSLSLVIGFILVIFYMFFKYKFLGFIANIALIGNLVLLMGILTILEATLTLPGIAGIILTVGMAVDANVLIFERIKEEAKTEKSLIHAFSMGYKKAQTAVLDANITTLISAIILFFLGSGPVKGFAVTLGLGILTTLFSAYFLARHLSSIYVMRNKDKKVVL